jgi:hypothetical protein
MDTEEVLKIHPPLRVFFIQRRGLSCLETFSSVTFKQSSWRNETRRMQTTFPSRGNTNVIRSGYGQCRYLINISVLCRHKLLSVLLWGDNYAQCSFWLTLAELIPAESRLEGNTILKTPQPYNTSSTSLFQRSAVRNTCPSPHVSYFHRLIHLSHFLFIIFFRR